MHSAAPGLHRRRGAAVADRLGACVDGSVGEDEPGRGPRGRRGLRPWACCGRRSRGRPGVRDRVCPAHPLPWCPTRIAAAVARQSGEAQGKMKACHRHRDEAVSTIPHDREGERDRSNENSFWEVWPLIERWRQADVQARKEQFARKILPTIFEEWRRVPRVHLPLLVDSTDDSGDSDDDARARWRKQVHYHEHALTRTFAGRT